ncbi:MAG: glycine dehydrogenase subunit 2, partial [Alphaproteobacteria bacterium]|nr:glycine dehydrogenase subunit 2 [Alphaproteobacteria bacterium]
MKRAVEKFHAARWNEPLIMRMSSPGERGVVLPEVEAGIAAAVGDVLKGLPPAIRRQRPPKLPEVSQPQVLRHYLRLSQMTMGADVTPDMMGTCTIKYSPKLHEQLVRQPWVWDLHPLQDEDTLQGILEIMYRFGKMMGAIAGLDAFTFQPGSGAQGIYTNACIIRAYHESRGELGKRREIITTAFSHPSDAAAPAVAGFRVLTLMPGDRGVADVAALKAVLSERTAGFMLTNPEDTGLYNPNIREMVDLVHKAGGLCAYDQANGNGLLGIVRAGDTGFDLCQFNLHKTFSAPHGGIGQGCAAVGVRKHLEPFLPKPVVIFDGKQYRLDGDRPQAIEKIRAFLGNIQTVLKAYAWVMNLGGEGLRAVAETAVLNSNYLLAKIKDIRGMSVPWPNNNYHRLEQVRYSMEKLHADTGVTTHDAMWRMVDFGMQHYMTSHHPMLVPEPFTIEPGESYSIDELDECVEIMRRLSEEAYATPEIVKSAPHRASVTRVDEQLIDDPKRWAFTYRAFLKKRKKERAAPQAGARPAGGRRRRAG